MKTPQLQCTDCQEQTVFLEDQVVHVNICQLQRTDSNFWMLHFPRPGKDFLLILHPSKDQRQLLRPLIRVGRGKGKHNQAICCKTTAPY